MILKFLSKSFFIVSIVFFSIQCTAQSFGGTNLSSEKPFFGEPPYTYQSCQNYFIQFKSSPDVLRSLVPEPLIMVGDSSVYLYFVKQNIVTPQKFDYYEAYFIIPVAYKETIGTYLPILYLNKIEGIIPGREIWGYNKFYADVEFKEENENVHITVVRNDTSVISAEFALGPQLDSPDRLTNSNVINLKYIPSAEKGSSPDVYQLIQQPMEIKSGNFRMAAAKLEFTSTRYDPIGKIPIFSIVQAGYAESSFVLNFGNILYDYLTE